MLPMIVVICIELSTLATAQSRRASTVNMESHTNHAVDVPVSVVSIQGVAGQSAKLPCDIQPSDSRDSVTMVLWFKESGGESVFSYDARDPHIGKSKISVPAYLLIQNIQESDEGEYRCRVDFQNSPTRNHKVNFTVIVLPSKPIIYDAKKRDVSTHHQTYPEGADLDLICEVHGGKPRPFVSWYLQSQPINSTYEVREDQTTRDVKSQTSSTIISRVTIKNLRREHHLKKLSCRASNTNLIQPLRTDIAIDLHMKPLSVDIVRKERIVSAGKTYEIECRSSGSRPFAFITWWKGSKQLKMSSKEFQKNGTSSSILEWVPSVDDDEKYLICRAENKHLPEAAIEDKWKLKVHFAPIVTLRMGSSLNPRNIKEGDDISFECNIRSNPREFQLKWFHENNELHHNTTAGILLSDQSLVLQSITRAAAGNYTCHATNAEGPNRSNAVHLVVMFAPICLSIINSGSTKIREPASMATFNKSARLRYNQRQETISLICKVEASPAFVTFRWTFNSSAERNDIPDAQFTTEGTLSKLNYTLKTDSDYGTLGCWASNNLGQSKQPCFYHLTAPGSPFPLQNCTAYNQSGAWIRISCIEGLDGGLPQKFVAVADEQRWESSTPYWEIEIHKPTAVSLYAVNSKGSSDPVILDVIAFKDVAKFTGETGISLDISPILIGLGGTATGLGLLVTGVLMALWRKHADSPSKPKPLPQPSIATFAGKGEEEDGNPDLIPTTALTNSLTDKKLQAYRSLPRRPHCIEDRQVLHSVAENFDYPRASPNTYLSLQRPGHYTETIIRHPTVQESCI